MPEPSPFSPKEKQGKPEEQTSPETPEVETPVPEAVTPELPRESEADRAAAIEQARAEIEALSGGETKTAETATEQSPTKESARTIEAPRAATFIEFARLLNPEQTAEVKQVLTEIYWGGLGDDAARLIDGEALPNLNSAYPDIDPTMTRIIDFFSQSGIDQADLEQTLGITFI